MNSPFYQPSRQSFGSSQNMQQPQGGYGGGGFGDSGGFQPQGKGYGSFGGQGFGQGFNQSFGNFGGGYGGGFSPFQGGFGGGFQPQFGGGQSFGGQGFQPQFGGGFGGGMQQGFNPMFGGIGSLGFNPQMGPQFGMPMGGFNPYQQQQQYNPYQQQQQQFAPQKPQGPYQQFDPNQDYGVSMQGFGRQQQQQQFQPQFNPQQQNVRDQQSLQQAQAAELAKTQPSNTDFYSPGSGMQTDMPPQQAMFGGIGGLGFNPMMGRNFGMPMGGFNPYQQQQQFAPQQMQQQMQQFAPQKPQGPYQQLDPNQDYGGSIDMRYRGGPEMSPQMRLQRGQDMQAMEKMTLTPEQKYQQAQQFGNQAQLYANSPVGQMAAARYAMG